MLWSTEVESMSGKAKVEKVMLFDNKTGKKTALQVDHVFVCIGSVSSKDCLERLGVRMEGLCVQVDRDGMTSIPGMFAAGDIVSDLKRIPQALATGEKAAYSAYKYLKNPYWK